MFLEREAPEKIGRAAAGEKMECERDEKNCRALAEEIIKARSGVNCGVSGSRTRKKRQRSSRGENGWLSATKKNTIAARRGKLDAKCC